LHARDRFGPFDENARADKKKIHTAPTPSRRFASDASFRIPNETTGV